MFGAWPGLGLGFVLAPLSACWGTVTHSLTQILEGGTHTKQNKGDKRADTQTNGHTRDTVKTNTHPARPPRTPTPARNSSPAASMLPCMLLAVSVSPTPSFSPRGSLRETAHVAGANSTLCDPVQQYSGFYELTTGSAKLEKNCEAARLKLARLVFGLAVRSCSLTASCSLMASCSLTARAPSISTPEKTSTGSSSRAALPRLTRS